jgi:hypothetical protein
LPDRTRRFVPLSVRERDVIAYYVPLVTGLRISPAERLEPILVDELESLWQRWTNSLVIKAAFSSDRK